MPQLLYGVVCTPVLLATALRCGVHSCLVSYSTMRSCPKYERKKKTEERKERRKKERKKEG